MKIAICDDNESDVLRTKTLLSDHPFIKHSIIDTYTSGSELLETIQNSKKYDAFFLDIDMPGINGLELGKKLKELLPKSYIVFITSYPQYSIDAFDCEAFHYLLKPINIEKAISILTRLVKKYQSENRYYIIKVKNENYRIPIKDIYYIECCRKHIIYHLKDKTYETIGRISKVHLDLESYGFVQIHQGYIVNMDKISQFDKYWVILSNGQKVMISVRRKSDVLLTYAKYIGANV